MGVAAVILALAACAQDVRAPGAPGSRIRVVVTFSILGDLVQHVAGDRIDQTTLVGPGSDVHDFEPSPSDAQKLLNAQVVIENGANLETWLDRIYTASGSKAMRVVAGQGIPPRSLALPGNEEVDPHFWQDVTNAITMTQNIRDGLARADPTNAPIYQANAAAYIVELQALDQRIFDEVKRLPPDQRRLVTSHDSLGYFAARYGFQVTGSLLGTAATASGDPSARTFGQLVQDIRASGVKAVFVENVANPANMERLAQEAGVKVGPQLYTDSLGPAGSDGDTYIHAMQFNAHAIVAALLGP